MNSKWSLFICSFVLIAIGSYTLITGEFNTKDGVPLTEENALFMGVMVFISGAIALIFSFYVLYLERKYSRFKKAEDDDYDVDSHWNQ